MTQLKMQTTLLILCLGTLSGTKAEEVQETTWEGDVPIVVEPLLVGTSDAEPQSFPITVEEYPDDRGKRQAIREDEVYMLFANRQYLVQMYLNTTVRNAFQLPEGSNAIACDYDIREGLFFWSDVANRVIAAARLDGTGLTTLLSRFSGITHPDGIAWDWTTKKLYWTDAVERDIEVYDPVTTDRKVLFTNKEGSIPRAIVLDPTTRMMYWTNWGDSPKIERASMDSSSRSVIVNTELGWPNGLTLDYATQTLYWADAQLDKLEKSNVDGSMRTRLITPTDVVLHPFGITFYRSRLYWSDWQANAIFTAPASSTLMDTTVFFSGLRFDPMQLHVLDEGRQPFVLNPCAVNNGGCSHLCLLSSTSARRYTCTCNVGMVLGLDGRTCL